MEALTEHPKTPAAELADERFARAIDLAVEGRSPYPSGAVFLAADMPRLGEVLSRHLREGRTIVLVFDDGEERLIEARRVRPSPASAAMVAVRASLDSALKRSRRTLPTAVERVFSKRAIEGVRRSIHEQQRVLARRPFPIPEYDRLSGEEIRGHLDHLSPGELRRVHEYELHHKGRVAVLRRAEDLEQVRMIEETKGQS